VYRRAFAPDGTTITTVDGIDTRVGWNDWYPHDTRLDEAPIDLTPEEKAFRTAVSAHVKVVDAARYDRGVAV
jgi:hypothetical protein